MQFSKYHALGNDYAVVEQNEFDAVEQNSVVSQICAQHFGVGADGILVRKTDPKSGSFEVQVVNPDGPESEKSGNGLRIFARYLWDKGLVTSEPFDVTVGGEVVSCTVTDAGRVVSVEMGQVTFSSYDIPVTGPPREVIEESITVAGRKFRFSAANIGNPNCVVLCDKINVDEVKTFGPLIETESRFPSQTNVQFMQVLDRENIRIEVWERGLGYMLATGTGSCAAAAVAHRLGLCDTDVTVHMPGGTLSVRIGPNFEARLTGPVVKVADGVICHEIFEEENLAIQTLLEQQDRTSVS
jgi:diaminopimelate epimerase